MNPQTSAASHPLTLGARACACWKLAWANCLAVVLVVLSQSIQQVEVRTKHGPCEQNTVVSLDDRKSCRISRTAVRRFFLPTLNSDNIICVFAWRASATAFTHPQPLHGDSQLAPNMVLSYQKKVVKWALGTLSNYSNPATAFGLGGSPMKKYLGHFWWIVSFD